MKKVFAILLAAVMLLSCAAFAENAGAFILSDPVFSMHTGDNSTGFDLTGVSLAVYAGYVDSVPALRLELYGGEEVLLGADAQLTEEQILFTLDGMSSAACIPMPEELKNMSNMDFSGIDLGIDAEALIENVMNSAEISGDPSNMTFKVPYTAVNELFSAVATAASQADVEIPGVDISSFASEVEEMKSADNGVNVEGSYKQTDAGFEASLNLFRVEKGVADAEAIVVINADLAETLNVTLSSGPSVLVFQMYPEEEEGIRVNLSGTSDDMGFDLSTLVGYGEAEANFNAIDAAGAINVEEMTSEQSNALMMEAYGALSGAISYFSSVLMPAA